MLHLTLISLMLPSFILSCTPPLPKPNATTTFPYSTHGPDIPSHPATSSYFINHFSLNVNNLTRSTQFYTTVLGMRMVFTYAMSPYISITYLGYPQGGRNNSGYQTSVEMLRDKQNSAGLLELFYFNRTAIGGDDIPGPAQMVGLFNHIGLVVPDVRVAQERLETAGSTIYKRVGEGLPDSGLFSGPRLLGDVRGLQEEDWQVIKERFGELNMGNCFASDPDGNVIEILPRDEPPLFG